MKEEYLEPWRWAVLWFAYVMAWVTGFLVWRKEHHFPQEFQEKK